MDIADFLMSPQASLPKSRKNGEFAEYYKQFTDDYFKLAKTVSNNGNLAKEFLDTLSQSIELRDAIVETIKHYYNGHTWQAYSILKAAVENFLPIISDIIPPSADKGYLKNLYRIRKSEGIMFTREEMFHIPFQLRHLVDTQRYSIPGFPSLYLSSSLFTTWKELGCPDLNSIVAIRAELADNVKLLDFGYPTQYLAQIIGSANKVPSSGKLHKTLIAPVQVWPLLAACSVSVLNRKSPFKPEYIIPQLLLQLVRNDVLGSDIHGIRYFSINYDQSYSIQLGANFVFPVKESRDNGHCPSLKGLFKLTEPLSWQLATAVDEEPDLLHASDVFLEILKGSSVPYRTTKFARVESMLVHQPANYL